MNNIDKIYGLCIHSERRKNLEKYERVLNINIDTSLSHNSFGKDKEYYIERNLIVPDYPDSIGAIGCTLSFGNIYKDIIDNKYKYALIFEDDIDWNSEFYGEISKDVFLNEINKIDFDGSWDIFYLGTENKGEIKNQKHIKDNIYELETGKIEIPLRERTYKSFNISGSSNKTRHRNFGGQQAFILSYNGAEQILKYYNPAYTISDGLVGYNIMNGNIINRSFIPTLFTQLSHPRLEQFDNKLWASQTGTNYWNTSEKYDENMKKNKKGCSAKPLSHKYNSDDMVKYKND